MSVEKPSGALEKQKLAPKNDATMIVDKACKAQQDAFTKTLDENLQRWVDVLSQSDFNKLADILKKHQVWLDLSKIQYTDINNGTGIIIKKDGGTFKVYNQNNPKMFWYLNTQIGTITNGTFEKLNVIVALFSENHNRIGENPIPQNTQTCEIEKILTPKEASVPVSDVVRDSANETHISHLIKKGESLWKIVKKYYQLSDTQEDANMVWNIIEMLKKDPKNKGIVKDDTGKIYLWETLYLPITGQFTYKGVQRVVVANESLRGFK